MGQWQGGGDVKIQLGGKKKQKKEGAQSRRHSEGHRSATHRRDRPSMLFADRNEGVGAIMAPAGV
jgi:hypothetical protein